MAGELYESDDLASNSEDEKCLRKAIESAGRKRKIETNKVQQKSKRTKCEDPEQQFFRAAAKRQASRPIQKKKPLPPDAIKDIIDKFGGRQNNLKELRIAALCSLGFAGFFRYDKLRSIKANHIEFLKEHIKI
ncbi:integrase recombinase xerD homolog [Paramuricea clavata]|uniref:Integrase recombinase xerD homolog n=1 Tax=Paramuricea clavata TaxID=317549 RepID=A0A6S7KUY8_PARCT|nr:integrase recombinase xerD homolog [Paramuricea clavata]